MPDINSLTTFSGLLTFAAVLSFFARRFLLSSALLIVAGAAGLGIVWDRWSLRTGHQVHVHALFSGGSPSSDEMAMVATHLPLLLAGLALLRFHSSRSDRA